MKNLFKKKELMEILMKGMSERPTSKLYRAIEKAYYSCGIEIFEKAGYVHFRKGAGYEASFPKYLVEDAIGTKVDVPVRAA